VVIRFSSGILAVMLANFSEGLSNVCIQLSYSGVKHSATITALTRIPYFNNSTAHSLVSAFLPPLDAAYADVFP